MDSIAESYGIPVSSVVYNNQLVYPYPLAVGQALIFYQFVCRYFSNSEAVTIRMEKFSISLIK